MFGTHALQCGAVGKAGDAHVGKGHGSANQKTGEDTVWEQALDVQPRHCVSVGVVETRIYFGDGS